MLKSFLEAAGKVASEYALIAYSTAALLAIATILGRAKLKRQPALFGLVILCILVLALSPLFGSIFVPRNYRLTVSVTDAAGQRLENPVVHVDVPAQVYVIGSSVQVEIDHDHLPQTHQITVFAQDGSGAQRGQSVVKLAEDHQPSVALRVSRQPTQVRGNVFDPHGVPIEGARVSVAGYPEFAMSGESGVFVLQTQLSDGETVELIVEKSGYRTVHQQHIAGSATASVQMEQVN
jgi:hypothetical protein